MGFGRDGLYFWYELPGRLRLLGQRFRAVGGPGLKKVSPSHLYSWESEKITRSVSSFQSRKHTKKCARTIIIYIKTLRLFISLFFALLVCIVVFIVFCILAHY